MALVIMVPRTEITDRKLALLTGHGVVLGRVLNTCLLTIGWL